MRYAAIVASLMITASCGGSSAPVDIAPGSSTCAQCKMAIVDQRLAAQIVSPSGGPVLFNDIGCMMDYLTHHSKLPAGTIAYVADHQTGGWIPAVSALYTRNLRVETPAGSHLIAHGTEATRAVDPAAQTGARTTVQDLLPIDMPDGTR